MISGLHRPDIVTLSDSLGGTASHGGYFRITKTIAKRCVLREIASRNPLLERSVGKLVSITKGWGQRNQIFSFLEWRFLSSVRRNKSTVHHILSGDWHWECVMRSAPRSLVATIHMPVSRWSPEVRVAISRLRGAIVLSSREHEAAADILGADRACLIKHPVDVDFFVAPAIPLQSRRVLFVGGFERDFKLFSVIAQRLLAAELVDAIDCVTPAANQSRAELADLRSHASVQWYSGISDDELLHLYQKACVAFIPFEDSTANNAVVECLATGCPLVTTDNGGIRSYGGGSIFPVFQRADLDRAFHLVAELLQDSLVRQRVANKMRHFAVNNLTYDKIADEHISAYEKFRHPLAHFP